MNKIVPKMLSLLTKTKLNLKKHPVISDLKVIDEYVKQRINHGAEINIQLSDKCTNDAMIRQTLRDVFKLTTFRPQQLQTITSVLSKKDVLMIAPSGGGKSLCFQLPAIVNYGFTLVISPLVALMQNQVWKLKTIGINAEYLSSTNDANDNKFIIEKMICNDPKIPSLLQTPVVVTLSTWVHEGNLKFIYSNYAYIGPLKLLYVTPERLAKSKTFMDALRTCYIENKLNLIAIDEVHCISELGHTFRPDYKKLSMMKELFPNTPILGVTATATNGVIHDIQRTLNIEECLVFKAPPTRPNFYYHVLEKPSSKRLTYELLGDLLKKRYAGKSGIIYAHSKRDCENISAAMNIMGLQVKPYHADLSLDERSDILREWLSGNLQAVVATIAFGMGIDKPDVRFVIHHTMSTSIQTFYQESGRAGRDGNTAESILLYSFTDIFRLTSLAQPKGLRNVYEMIAYAISGHNCRHVTIEKHFTDSPKDAHECNRMCDHCDSCMHSEAVDITNYSLDLYKLLENAKKMKTQLTGSQLVDVWYRDANSKFSLKNVPVPIFDKSYAEQMVAFLIIKNILKEKFHKTKYNTQSYVVKGDVIPKNVIFYRTPFLNLPQDMALEKTLNE